MPDQMTRGELLDRIATSYANWQALVVRVPRARMTGPGFAGAWSLKDVIAHITVYERWTADNLEASERGERLPDEVPWGPPDGNTADMDARNAAYWRHYRETPLDDVRAVAREHHQRLVMGVERLAESDINNAEKYAWTVGYPVWRAIAGNSYEHYDDHQPGVRAWLEVHPS
jgi:hypothetical protein